MKRDEMTSTTSTSTSTSPSSHESSDQQQHSHSHPHSHSYEFSTQHRYWIFTAAVLNEIRSNTYINGKKNIKQLNEKYISHNADITITSSSSTSSVNDTTDAAATAA